MDDHRIRVKICCIASVAEAETAIRHGADALGLVSAMPSGPGVISDEEIAAIVRRVPPPVATFLLTSRRSSAEIVEQVRHARADTVQICDRLPDGRHRDLRDALPGVRRVQVVHVVDEGSVDEALAVAPEVDALLLDSGNPNLATKELGGTGRVHDWRLSRRIREASPVPVFLAGGLRPDNVAAAVAAVEPFAVDVCSGVRTGGRLDEAKLAAFFRALQTPCDMLAPTNHVREGVLAAPRGATDEVTSMSYVRVEFLCQHCGLEGMTPEIKSGEAARLAFGQLRIRCPRCNAVLWIRTNPQAVFDDAAHRGLAEVIQSAVREFLAKHEPKKED